MNRILVAGLLALTVTGIEAQPKGRGGSDWQFMGAEAGRPGAVVKNAPFSADIATESSMLLQDGNHIRQTSTLRFYRDSEGRTRREQSLNSVGGLATNANLPTVVFISQDCEPDDGWTRRTGIGDCRRPRMAWPRPGAERPVPECEE